MKTCFALAVFVGVFSGALRADFGFQSRTQITGGTLVQDLQAKKPEVFTQLIKGHRMTIFNKKHATVINLDNDTVLEIDFAKKTFFSKKFAEIKQNLDSAMKDRTAFQVSSKTGSNKAVGVLNARERIVTMTREGAGPQGVAHIFLDCWTMSLPGFEELEDFRHRLAAKLGYAFALGLSEIGMAKPELLPGLEELAKVIVEGDHVSVETTIRMGSADSGDLAPTGDAAAQKSGILTETLGRLENLGRKKNRGVDPGVEYPGLLAEITTELGNFSSAPADEAKFNVPPGFKEVKPSH